MHPYLIDFGTHTLPWLGDTRIALPAYGLMMAIGIVLAWSWFVRNAARAGIDRDAASNVIFWSLVGGMVGGKLGLLLVEWRDFVSEPSRLLEADFLTAAGVIWTGVLAGMGTLIFLAWRGGMPVWRVVDAAIVPVPLAQAIGRVGCLLGGCCFGRPTDLPWGLIYSNGDGHERTGVPLGIPLHPFPLYEALFSLLVMLPALLWLRRRQRFAGELALAYLVIYGTARLLLETTRGDAVRGVTAGGLSTSQIISLIVIPLAIAAWLVKRRQPPATAAEPTP